MHVVVHPLIDGRSLFADGFQRGMRMKKSQRGGEAVVGDAKHSDLAVVVGDVFDEPFDGVVGVGGFVGGLGIVEVNLGGKFEVAFGLEAAAQILNDEDVAVLHEFLEIRQAPGPAAFRGRRKECGEKGWEAAWWR